ncbi:MAG: MerR family transcriptional regulator [Pseudomonadota bacterium]
MLLWLMVTTRVAAEIIGVRYEALRNWLKQGLLHNATPEARSWRRYGATDLCCLQLMKEGLAAGIPSDTLIDICSDAELRRIFDRLSSGTSGTSFSQPQYLLVWSTLAEPLFMLSPARSVAEEIGANPHPVTVVDLTYVQSTIADELARRA